MQKKYFLAVLLILFLFTILSGCNNNGEVMNDSGSFDHELDIDLLYEEFELEIESATHELEVEFKQSYDELYAEVEFEQDDYKEVELTGAAALEHLLPILENLNIDSSMSEDEIVGRVLTAFDWNRSYDDFELEVSFMDGSYIDIDREASQSYQEQAIDLPYEEFELEIESATHELEVEFEQSYDELDAEVEFEQGDYKEVELTGAAALDYLLPILENLDIDSSMSEEQIIERVLTAFDWNRSYDDFELEVRFMDGSYIDIDY